ncbi:DNA polymerase III subunit delta' [Oleiagrimonas sp. C23AA]|uniref:DNA polymerase III subunit delta' n=1 Tax=Oleiagrimonas sp. C23AA TaxID=2719047 RepID=UPI001421BA30|nr:DNA polymerase III subunit delta' [Oleiagrimonas sp. C23AA]NII10325.1 DNA polymerase III subunit delta' [Oleiagrimonas sp. C23AA]
MTVPGWHHDAWQRLQTRRERGVLPHALALTGPQGLGKRAFVKRFVNSLLCQQRQPDGEACGQCRSCLLLAAGTHPDFISTGLETRDDGKLRSEILIRQIRALSERLSKASQFGGWQIAVIDPADAMNTASANALLKTLEEPTSASLLLLVADAPWRLPATIRSRCQRIEFRLPSSEQAAEWLRAEGVGNPEQALAAAGGNPGLAQNWASSGATEQRSQVRADLAALAEGRADAFAVASQWAGDEPSQRLWFAAQAAADEARQRASGQAGVLHSRLSDQALHEWFVRAGHTRELLRGPLRTDLMVLELLADWH